MTSTPGRRTDHRARAGIFWDRWRGLVLTWSCRCSSWLVAPLAEVPHRDDAIVVGSYFASFLFADSTTTNALGVDAGRVSRRLEAGVALRRVLLAKNLTLLLVMGLLTLAATAVITLRFEPAVCLARTLPAVLVPVLVRLGLGNLVSVLLPVSALSLRQRWQQRRNLDASARWLAVTGLPYALCLVVDPLGELPTLAFRVMGAEPRGSIAMPAAVFLACGLLSYAALTAAAIGAVRHRMLRFHDLPEASGGTQASRAHRWCLSRDLTASISRHLKGCF